MSIGRKWKEIIDITDKITYGFHVSFFVVLFYYWQMNVCVCVFISLIALIITGWFQKGKISQKSIQCVIMQLFAVRFSLSCGIGMKTMLSLLQSTKDKHRFIIFEWDRLEGCTIIFFIICFLENFHSYNWLFCHTLPST